MKIAKKDMEDFLKGQFDQDAFDSLVNDVIHQHRQIRDGERVEEEVVEEDKEKGPKPRRFKDREVFFGSRADRGKKAAVARKVVKEEILKL